MKEKRPPQAVWRARNPGNSHSILSVPSKRTKIGKEGWLHSICKAAPYAELKVLQRCANRIRHQFFDNIWKPEQTPMGIRNGFYRRTACHATIEVRTDTCARRSLRVVDRMRQEYCEGKYRDLKKCSGQYLGPESDLSEPRSKLHKD